MHKAFTLVDDVPTMIETNHIMEKDSRFWKEDLNRSLCDILQKHKITLEASITLEVVYANAPGSKFVEYKKEACYLLLQINIKMKETIVCIKTSVLYRTIKILSLK